MTIYNICDQGGNSTMQLFLKYSPDSLTRLFDRCLTKPCMAQVTERSLVIGSVNLKYTLRELGLRR